MPEIQGTNLHGPGVIVDGYGTREPAKVSWPAESIPPGQQAHLGNGLWLTRCSDPVCDVYTLSRGSMPGYAYGKGIGYHEIEAHNAKVAGINVGMLP